MRWVGALLARWLVRWSTCRRLPCQWARSLRIWLDWQLANTDKLHSSTRRLGVELQRMCLA